MYIDLGPRNPIVRDLFGAHQNKLDIHFFLDILTDNTFTIQFSDWLSQPNTSIDETTTPFKSFS